MHDHFLMHLSVCVCVCRVSSVDEIFDQNKFFERNFLCQSIGMSEIYSGPSYPQFIQLSVLHIVNIFHS